MLLALYDGSGEDILAETDACYNTAARLTSVTSSYSDPNNPPNLISAMHYSAFGGLTSDTLGSGETETYAYVPKLTRLQSYSAVLNTTTTYSFNITSFAPNGNVLAATDTANGNWNYSYDQFNRLVCANLASNGTCTTPPTGTPTYTYVYDRFGNRWQQNGPHAFIASFTGNSSTNNNRMDGYSYDAAGNLMNDGTHQYTYDAENRIISVDNGNTATYAYDPDGHRVEKISTVGNGGDPPGTWQFLYDQSGRMVKRFEGALWKGETYAGARHLATLGAGTEFSHADWLGTERVRTGLANSAWKVCESIASLPFGDGQTTTGVCYQSSPLHFTGKFRDSDSGLDYFGARFDASSMGRFLSPDPRNEAGFDSPEDPQGWNGYSYVRNSPLNAIDPDGNDHIICGLGQDQNKCARISDEQFKQFKKDNPNLVFSDGQVFSKNADGSLRQTGREWYEGSNDVSDDFLGLAQRGRALYQIGFRAGLKGFVRGLLLRMARGGVISNLEDAAERSIKDPSSMKGATAEEVEKAVPSHWPLVPTKGSGGWSWVDPARRGDQVRLMPGNPADPNPVKQGPYIRISIGGQTSPPIPAAGNPTLSKP